MVPVMTISEVLSSGASQIGKAADHGIGRQMHERDEDEQADDGGARAGGGRRSSSPAIRATRAASRAARTRRARRPSSCGGGLVLRQARGTCPRGWRRRRPFCCRSSSSVPSATSRPAAMTPMRSAMRSATSRICVVMITEQPARDALAQQSLTTRADTASRPVSGSSRMISRGSCTSAPASATFWRMPLENPSQRSSRCGSSPSEIEQLVRRRLGEVAGRRPTARRRIRDIPAASACRRSSARPRPTP